MRTVEEILQAEKRYYSCWQRPNEGDLSINDLNRELITALAAEHPAVLLGQYNSTELTPYTGQEILNFAFQFCVPVAADTTLNNLLQKRNATTAPTKHLDAIMCRVEALGGHLLLWA